MALVGFDTVCIHQDDPAEKASQVQRMGLRYVRSHRVIAWLGHPDESANEALSLFQRFHDAYDRSVLSFTRVDAFDRVLGLTRDSPIWSGMALFFEKEWFARLWVVQEAALAPRLCL